MKTSILIGGTVAIDHVKTPTAEAQNLLGGSAAYAALAAAFFSPPVDLIGIIGHDFPQAHLDMLQSRGVTLDGVERSPNESFTWSGEYHANMNERTTHRVGLNVLENWHVHVPAALAAAPIIVLANMSPDNQLEMLAQTTPAASASASSPSTPSSPLPAPRFIIADTMDLWIEIANERLHEVLPQLDLFVLNEGEARALAATSNLVEAGKILLGKGPQHVIIKLGEFGAMLFSKECGVRNAECGMEESSSSTSSSSTSSIPHSPLRTPHFRCSAFPLATLTDPTGAGDTFLGGIAGHLAASGPPPYDLPALRTAIIHGSILASFTCEAFSTRRLESLTPADFQARLSEFQALTAW